jgi:hypothetical protein
MWILWTAGGLAPLSPATTIDASIGDSLVRPTT